MTGLITQPGVYQVRSDIYHADPCPEPSMSAGLVDFLIDQCPAKAWANHPRLNPAYQHKNSRVFDIGIGAHLMQLEPDAFDAAVTIVKSDNWRTDWAQSAATRAREEGKTPLLIRDADMIIGMRGSLRENALAREAFANGKAERSVFVKSPAGIWRRCRPDLTAYHGGWLADYKTVDNANPSEFGKISWNYRWHRRAAWYLQTFSMATGAEPQRYFFIVQEKWPPYGISVCELDFADIDAGREDCEEAERIFAECLARGSDLPSWPWYQPNDSNSDGIFRATLPYFAHLQIAEIQERRDIARHQRALRMMHEPIGDENET